MMYGKQMSEEIYWGTGDYKSCIAEVVRGSGDPKGWGLLWTWGLHLDRVVLVVLRMEWSCLKGVDQEGVRMIRRLRLH